MSVTLLCTHQVVSQRMDVDSVMKELEEIHFYSVEVRSVSTRAEFSQLKGTFLYKTPPMMKVSAANIYGVLHDILRGQGKTEAVRAAVKRLKQVAEDEDIIPELVTALSEATTERMQFLHLAEMLLSRLTSSKFEVDRRTYSDVTLQKFGATRLRSRYMGMGDVWTWHGTAHRTAEPIASRR